MIIAILGLVLTVASSAQSQPTCTKFEDCLKDLNSPDVAKKSSAIFMLGNMKDKRATPALVAIIKEEGSPELRMSALRAISAIRDPAAVQALTDLLGDKNLQQEVVQALVKIGNTTAVEALMEGLKQPNVQLAAARGLGEIADPSAKPALLRLIRESNDERVRGVSILAVQRINSIWGPTEQEMGIPKYPQSEFMPNAQGEWIFVSKDPLPKITDFYRSRLKKPALTFQEFEKKYEKGIGESEDGAPSDNPNVIFVAKEQQFEGHLYPEKLIFLQKGKGETEIRIFHAAGPD